MNSPKPIISKNIRLRYPEAFSVGNYSVVDDFCYFSTQFRMNTSSHIANNCSIAGGKEYLVTIGDFCSISAGCRLWCQSNHFTEDIVCLLPSLFSESEIKSLKLSTLSGNIIFSNYTALGCNSVVMPKNHIPEGTVIGAQSFVPFNFKFEPWSVYVGNPIKKIKDRNKKNVLRQINILKKKLNLK